MAVVFLCANDEFALPLAEENNNDSGRNQFYTVTALVFNVG